MILIFDSIFGNLPQPFRSVTWVVNKRQSISRLKMMPRSSLTDLEPQGASRREQEAVGEKFMSSGLRIDDASVLFSKYILLLNCTANFAVTNDTCWYLLDRKGLNL